MKKSIIILSLILLSTFALCQVVDKPSKFSTSVSIAVKSVEVVKSEFDSLLSFYGITPSFYQTGATSFNINLYTEDVTYYRILDEIKKWGYITGEKTTFTHDANRIVELQNEIDNLNKEKAQYEKLVTKLDSSDLKYFEFWQKIIDIDIKISGKELQINMDNLAIKQYALQIRFEEDKKVGDSYDNSWVNMPGIEGSLLFTEQPKRGVSPKYMIGYNLKYLFNYKKSYAVLGLYKSVGRVDNTSVNETYIFALGQDFYSRRLGRGQRKFLNLYTSFNLGFYISSSETKKSNSWFVNPFIGIELFKSKNIIIDNKIGYFLPFQNNRNQRGALYNLSFNFVF